jgi:hypothetical protein
MALIDVIRKKKPNIGTAPVSARDVQKQAATGATGKVQEGQAPSPSNIAAQQAANEVGAQQQALNLERSLAAGDQATQLAEQQAAQATAAQGQQIQREQSLADLTAKEQMRGQRLQTEEEMQRAGVGEREKSYYVKLNNQYANSLANLANERGVVENDLFQSLSQEMDSLTDDEAASRLEQTAHALAMADKSYLDEIERIGAERNLRDEINFKREAANLVFGKNLELLNKRLDSERLLNMDAREFKIEMAQMDINFAIEVAQQAAKAQAAANIISGGVQAASAIDWSSDSSSDQSFREEYGAPSEGRSTFGGPR